MSKCCKRNKIPQLYAIEFITMCYEGAPAHHFDDLLERARADDRESEIFEAVDADGNFPYQRAIKYGNWEALEWIFKKWDEAGLPLDVNRLDSEQNTPLIACCLRGFSFGTVETAASMKETQNDRLKCVKLLVNRN